MVTKKDIIEYIENLPERFYKERWEKGIEKVGEKEMFKAYDSFEHYLKKHKEFLLFSSPRRVGYDLYFIDRYKEIFDNVSKEDFEMYYGKMAYYDTEKAIKRQNTGPEAYI